MSPGEHPHVADLPLDALADERAHADLLAEAKRLRAQVAELLPWAEIGALAVQDWDGYETDESGQGIDRATGLALLDRIDAAEFLCLWWKHRPRGDA